MNTTTEHPAALARTLRDAASRLQQVPLSVLLESLEAFTRPWRETDTPERAQAAERISRSSGLHPGMVATTMAHCARLCTVSGLAQLLRAELGTLAPPGVPVADPERAVETAWHPPALTVEVLAGTLPTLALESIVESLLLRSPLLIRPSARDRQTTDVLLEQLQEHAPTLAPFVIGCHWARDQESTTREVLEHAELVVAWGSDDTIERLRRHTPSRTRYIGHGHRVSIAVIGPHEDGCRSDGHQLARSLALDTALFDQRGCMSPHTVFVHKDSEPSLNALAELLATEALPEVERLLPRGRIGHDVAAQVMQLRGVSEFAGCARTGPTFTVILHETCAFHPAPPARVLHLVPWSTPDDLSAALAPLRGHLSTIALSAGPAARRSLQSLLQSLGVPRICAPGRMQRPLLLRHHDGRPRLADRVHWMDIEPVDRPSPWSTQRE